MTTKTKPSKNPRPNQTKANGKTKEYSPDTVARAVLQPTVQAAVTLQKYGKSYGDIDILAMDNCLTKQTKKVVDGDLTRSEVMLTAQAHTLDAIFNNLAQRAALNIGEYLEAGETYLKLALRAQSQCRATWKTLATIKNPPIAGYVGQANIAHGHQQVNNESSLADRTPRARKNQSPQNKLLEEKDGERLDTRTTNTAEQVNPAMATLGEINRTADPGR